MPDPRLVGLHELRALIDRLNEANLRVTSAMSHLSLLMPGKELDFDELISIKTTIENDLLPRCIEVLKGLEETALTRQRAPSFRAGMNGAHKKTC